ncbi:hypothetical protein S7711_11476 [Stachybotrys chartarum IBT 7711]|uniref:Uncharacterized protein n=1 Tax=Stachybotrys chartarum (strain CBS 109288 / IBT 7711) TaxID=1280523 RepID=A0A084B821_STACB|nr:hypothetical protein S7711_11476 [Stachybotrys chartarum IBT 7711]
MFTRIPSLQPVVNQGGRNMTDGMEPLNVSFPGASAAAATASFNAHGSMDSNDEALARLAELSDQVTDLRESLAENPANDSESVTNKLLIQIDQNTSNLLQSFVQHGADVTNKLATLQQSFEQHKAQLEEWGIKLEGLFEDTRQNPTMGYL